MSKEHWGWIIFDVLVAIAAIVFVTVSIYIFMWFLSAQVGG